MPSKKTAATPVAEQPQHAAPQSAQDQAPEEAERAEREAAESAARTLEAQMAAAEEETAKEQPPETAAIIAREIAGLPAPAAAPQEQGAVERFWEARKNGPTKQTRHRPGCMCDWCVEWTMMITPQTQGQYQLPPKTVINKKSNEVLWTAEEVEAQYERERIAAGGAPKKTEESKKSEPAKKAERVQTLAEKALEAVKAGSDEVPAEVMDPAATKLLLGMGRHLLIGALEAQVKAEKANKEQREQALRAAAQKEYEEACKKAEAQNAPWLAQIAECEAELAPLRERVAELEAEIEDLQTEVIVIPKPAILGGATKTKSKAEAEEKGNGERRTPRRDGVVHDDQRYKFSVPYQTWLAFNRRFPDDKRRQSELTPVARANDIPLKDLSEITDDMLDRLYVLMLKQES
jgi:hypothetical protein